MGTLQAPLPFTKALGGPGIASKSLQVEGEDAVQLLTPSAYSGVLPSISRGSKGPRGQGLREERWLGAPVLEQTARKTADCRPLPDIV